MNKQMQTLLEQAREEVRSEEEIRGVAYRNFEQEVAAKFAELIVRECIQTLRDNTPVVDEHDSVEDWDRGYIRAMVDCEHHIQEHFGVK